VVEARVIVRIVLPATNQSIENIFTSDIKVNSELCRVVTPNSELCRVVTPNSELCRVVTPNSELCRVVNSKPR